MLSRTSVKLCRELLRAIHSATPRNSIGSVEKTSESQQRQSSGTLADGSRSVREDSKSAKCGPFLKYFGSSS